MSFSGTPITSEACVSPAMIEQPSLTTADSGGRSRPNSNLPKRVCVLCGNEYAPKASRQKYCDIKCYDRFRGNTDEARARKRECHQKHWQSWASTHNKRQARRVALLVSDILWICVCKHCNATSFSGRRVVQCASDDCRRSTANRKARDREARLFDPKPKQCKECRRMFTPEYGSKKRTFCSDECRLTYGRRVGKAMRRARWRELTREPIDPRDIFRRDKWMCHICSKPVNRSAKCPHPRAATIDHVVPIALGGAHVKSNVKCAHFICNSKKGAKVIGQQLFPFGINAMGIGAQLSGALLT